MPRPSRRGLVYFGLDIAEPDLKVVRAVAAVEDRSAGYIIRKVLANWIATDPELAKMKAALVAESAKATPRSSAKKTKAGSR